LTQAVRPLPPGMVRVAWRTVSADGHPVEGQFTFTNAAPAPVPASSSGPPSAGPPTTASSLEPTAAAPTVHDTGSGGLGWIVTGGVAALLALLGGALWWRRRTTTA
jgi:hypothetical protein